MQSINDFAGQELQWVHPKLLKPEYELRAGDEVLARLNCKGAFKTFVRAETANGSWIIERKGISKPVTILAGDTETELATVKGGISGKASLVFSDGRKYKWQSTSFWRDTWTWLNEEGTPLLQLKRGARVQIEPAGRNIPEIALLAVLSWYLHKQQEETATSSVLPFVG